MMLDTLSSEKRSCPPVDGSVPATEGEGLLHKESFAPLDPPEMAKAVSVPERVQQPTPASQQRVPKLISTAGDRALPIPQHLLGDDFDVSKICTLSFREDQDFRNYGGEFASLSAAVEYAAMRVAEFTNGPSFEIYGEDMGAKCWNLECEACFPKTVVLKHSDHEQYRDCRRGYNSDCSDSSDCPSDDGSDEEPAEPKKKCTAAVKTRTKLKLGRGVHRGTFNGKPITVIIYSIGDPIKHRCRDYIEALRYTLVADRGEEQHLKAFLEACLDYAVRLFRGPKEIREKGKTTFSIYRWQDCRWKREKVCEARHMDTVILDEGLKDHICGDMDFFFKKSTAAWYIEHGLPYKRSYLFYGPPGTGKTSMITALAGKYQKNVCFVTLSDRNMDDKQLTECLERLPRNPFVVLEDIDSVFTKDRDSRVRNQLSFSGLLNALDGIGYKFGAVFFMTTNFVGRLDSALLRAGRCDVKLQFDKASDWQLDRFFRKFYQKTTEAGALEAAVEVFVKNARAQFAENGVTLSTMQQHFVNHMLSDAMACAKGVLEYEVDEHDQDARKMRRRREREGGDSDDDRRGRSRSRSPSRGRSPSRQREEEATENQQPAAEEGPAPAAPRLAMQPGKLVGAATILSMVVGAAAMVAGNRLLRRSA